MDEEAKQFTQQDIDEATKEAEEELANYKKFAFQSNMMRMAVSFILGAAFQKVVTSISENLLMPLINFFINKTGVEWRKFIWTPIEGMSFEIGKFLGAFVDFLIISIILYILWKKLLKGDSDPPSQPPPQIPPPLPHKRRKHK